MQIPQSPSHPSPLRFIAFNQDGTCFTTVTRRGYSVFNSFPIKHLYSADFQSPLSMAVLLFRSSISALASDRTLQLYDDQSQRYLGEHTFGSSILNINLTRNQIIVVQERKTSIFNLNDMAPIEEFETAPNPHGAIASQQNCIAMVGPHDGEVRINSDGGVSKVLKNVCKSQITQLAISADGKYLATSSSKGTLIRIWSIQSQRMISELRRGNTPSKINSICFGANNNRLSVTSDHSTLHIFDNILTESDKESKSVFKLDTGCSKCICKFVSEDVYCVGDDMKIFKVDQQYAVTTQQIE